MSRGMDRSMGQAQARANWARNLMDGAARREAAQSIAADDLMVVGGTKLDMSKPIPDEQLPDHVCYDGVIWDITNPAGPVQVTLKDSITIDGRVIAVGDFGGDATGHVVTLYEQWLQAFTQDAKSWFYKFSAHEGATVGIIEHCESQARRLLQKKVNPEGVENFFIDWSDPEIEFDHWMQWVAATLRWRIKDNIRYRYEAEIDIRKREYMRTVIDICETTLVAVEKYLALPAGKKLTAV